MERNEVPKLFALLRQLYARFDKQPDRVTSAIWAEILKPWSYEQVRDAVIRRARENQYCPDPSEIVEYLPAVEQEKEEQQSSCEIPEEHLRWVRAWKTRLAAELEQRGLPPFTGNTGADYKAWRKKCVDAGVDFDALDMAVFVATCGYKGVQSDA